MSEYVVSEKRYNNISGEIRPSNLEHYPIWLWITGLGPAMTE
jgi:hypothetical protein